MSFAEDGSALDLAVTKSLWQDAFDNVDITFGPAKYDHIYRRHSDFLWARRKRQDELTADEPLDIPQDGSDGPFDLASELLDYTFGADDFLAGLDSVANLSPRLPIDIGCKNCSTRGQIVLTQGAIKIDTKQIDLVLDMFEGGDDGKEIGSIITDGYMDLVNRRLQMGVVPTRLRSHQHPPCKRGEARFRQHQYPLRKFLLTHQS